LLSYGHDHEPMALCRSVNNEFERKWTGLISNLVALPEFYSG